MNRFFRCTILLSYLLVSSAAGDEIAVKILDAPERAFSFEPIYVTFEVRNESGYRLVIPADKVPHEGAVLIAGKRGGDLEVQRKISDLTSRRLVWLGPGEKWLFFQQVQLGPEGIFDIQAVLRSPGECYGRPVGPDAHRIAPVRPIEYGSRPYDCWSGEERSQRISVEVRVPESEVDRAAADFIQIDGIGFKNSWRTGLILNFRQLWSRFPTSHYTYAAFRAAGDARGMLNVVILQPDNPLNPWVAAAMAEGLAYHNRPCAPPRRERPGAPLDLAKRYARVIAAYPPPGPVKDYLRQVEREIAAEECPAKKAAEDPGPARGTDAATELTDG